MSKVVLSSLSGLSVVDDLLGTLGWDEDTISFGFTSSRADYDQVYGIGEANRGYQEFSVRQKDAARDAMELWDELIDLSLVEVSGASADIRIASSAAPNTAWAYNPGDRDEAGDAWFGTTRGFFNNPEEGNYGFYTMVHEFGHSLGLEHPHDGVFQGRSAAQDVENTLGTGASAFVSPIDAMAYSVMSYSSFAGDGKRGYTNSTWDYAQTPMLRDVATVQHMYGANYETRSGDTVYSWNERTGEKSINSVGQGAPGGNTVFETLWDGNGRDTIDASNYDSDVSIDLMPGSWTTLSKSQTANLGSGNVAPGNVALAYLHQGDVRSLIENAIGGEGDDSLSGNAANNVLLGGGGDDRLVVTQGDNILAGGDVGNALALLGLSLPEFLSTGSKVTQTDGDDTLIGGAGNDVFVASDGNDTVEGGGGLNTLIIETTLSEIATQQRGNDLVFLYDGLEITTTDIDYVAFQDGVYAIVGSDAPVSFETAARAGDQITLVYNAGLNREIDSSGLNHWVSELNTGGSLNDLATGIINSQEFKSAFGDVEEGEAADFVQILYTNVLDREGDQAGVDFWVDGMAAGQTKADVLVAFSLSEENRDAVTASNGQGPDDQTLVDMVAVSQQHWMDNWVG